MFKHRLQTTVITSFIILAILSVYFALQLNFTFSLDQFFPEGDADLEYYKEFTESFETDINYYFIAFERKDGVFDQQFLEQVHDFTLKSRKLPHITESQSLTKLSYPLKTPFGITTIPAIHINDPSKYEKDKARILKDERLVYNLITEDATALLVNLKVIDNITLDQSQELVEAMKNLLANYQFEEYYQMSPAFFQTQMVDMQKREIIVSSIISGILVSIIMFLLFRRPWGIFIAIISIGLGLLLFLGFLGLSGRDLNVMAALYPVLMIIVGTSDVIHIMSKYIDELRKGLPKKEAIKITIKEIGLATLFTSVTTAIGFATLMTSRIGPIKGFGLNAAIGVMIAYLTVVIFTTALLSMFKTDQLIKLGKGQAFWENLMEWFYHYTKNNPKRVALGGVMTILICMIGISKVTTNYRVESNLPRGAKVTSDFVFFEKNFAGFRPLEFAVYAKGDLEADDYKVLKEVDKLEDYLHEQPYLRAINSLTTVYKSINQMNHQNRQAYYQMPKNEKQFNRYSKMIEKVPQMNINILLSKDKKKTRITSRIVDMGADSVKYFNHQIDNWIASNIDTSIVSFKQTGTGVIIDKNATYIRENLIQGLGLAILIVSLLMALLFKNIKMVIISLVPNLIPLLITGALLGYAGIELEAGVAIVFAIVFGIAVDDTIHFLSKYKLAKDKGLDMEAALHVSYLETGKAICLTSIILFFGFLVMLFSIHPPSVTVGSLISLTLVSALLSDLFLIPVMIRWIMKE